MNASQRIIVMILVGVLIASGIIVGVSALEKGQLVKSPTVSTTISVTTSISVSVETTSTPTGSLAISLTDPSTIPPGASHLYVAYSDIEAHTGGSGNNSVWATLATNGRIDLTTLQNVSVTLGSANVVSGSYDQVRIDISSAVITYIGKNYTVLVPSAAVISSISSGGIRVEPNGSSGILVSLIASVLPFPAGSSISFQMTSVIRAVPIPQSYWQINFANRGSIINISTQPWYSVPATTLQNNFTTPKGFPEQISGNSILLVLNNTGSTFVTISSLSILVASTSIAEGQPIPHGIQYVTVACFQILNDNTLVEAGQQVNFDSLGDSIAPGSQALLVFAAPISSLNSPFAPYLPIQITGGQTYKIVIGTPSGATFQMSVIASYGS